MTSEGQVIRKSKMPVTVDSLQADFAGLGVESGMVLLVHSSLSAMGWVNGGTVAVIIALQNILGCTGTLVMPSHSTGLSDPGQWENPLVPRSWWHIIRETMPAYRPDLTPTRSMGIVAETFRKQNGVLRSAHPRLSFCAFGARAKEITDNHFLAFGMGEGSPLARIYDLDRHVLLLGVGHDRNSFLHLAEYRATCPTKRIVREGAPICTSGARTWATFENIDLDASDFEHIGDDFVNFEAGNVIHHGRVGLADCQLMPQREIVDFAVDWIEMQRAK